MTLFPQRVHAPPHGRAHAAWLHLALRVAAVAVHVVVVVALLLESAIRGIGLDHTVAAARVDHESCVSASVHWAEVRTEITRRCGGIACVGAHAHVPHGSGVSAATAGRDSREHHDTSRQTEDSSYIHDTPLTDNAQTTRREQSS